MSKSGDMRSDVYMQYGRETRQRIDYLYDHWNKYDDAQARALDEMRRESHARYMRGMAAADTQEARESVGSAGCGCCAGIAALGLVVAGILFSSRYPGLDDVINLLRSLGQ
jgi:hypothetical protein